MPTALHVQEVPDAKPGKVYFPLENKQFENPELKENQVLVRIIAVALNHRDLFVRQLLYPGVSFDVPLCSDACGVVTSTGSSSEAKAWLNKRVIMNPGTGWKDSPEGPESPKGYAILGGTKLNKAGTAVTEYVSDIGELEVAPPHLNDKEAAALPLTGLTAYRATHTKAAKAMTKGANILITGIGGGVAIMALLYAVGAGANVFVTSGSQEKIDRAVKMGAKGGVSYKEDGWDKTLLKMLPEGTQKLDAIIDGAGGDIVEKGAKILKPGGIIAVYGMTVSPKMNFIMPAVLQNIEVRGSTMGSRKEFKDMVKFVTEKKLHPIVSKVANGLDNIKEIDALFEEMQNSAQFGKLVIQVSKGEGSKL